MKWNTESINSICMLRETIKIDKWSFGTHVECMDLEIYKGFRFFGKGMLDIRLHQKPENKFLCLPAKSGQELHSHFQLREWGAKKMGLIKFLRNQLFSH